VLPPPNQPPVANPDSAATSAGVAVAVAVLANDTDPNGDPLAITAVGGAVGGSAAITGSTVTFTPAAGFSGAASFTYTISDGRGGTASTGVSVTVTLTGSNNQLAFSSPMLRSTEATTILPWLLAAGLGLETRDEYGRTPLMTQVLSAAPPETIRSTVEAGADPRAKDEYTEQTIAEMVEYSGRDDLDFLVALGSDDDDEDQDD